jgi:hypothetical protein
VKSDLSSNVLTQVAGVGAHLILDGGYNFSVSGSTITGYSPFAIAYSAADGSGNQHLFVLNLFNAAAVPTPTQISNLSVPTSADTLLDSTCVTLLSTNVLTPTTAFLVVQIPSTGNPCSVSRSNRNNSYVIVRYTDSASTTPIGLPSPIKTTDIEALFNGSGAMTGMVLVDNLGNLNFYPASGFPNFTGAVTIASGLTGHSHFSRGVNRSGQIPSTGSVLFYQAKDATTDKVYFISSAGTATVVYTVLGAVNSLTAGSDQMGFSVSDNNNCYFTDVVNGGATATYSYIEAPFSGASATKLYTTPASSSAITYGLVDSDGTRLIIDKVDATASPATTTVSTLSVSAAGQPTTLFTSDPATMTGIQSFLNFSSDHLFINEHLSSIGSASVVYSPSSTTPALGPTANSRYLPFQFLVGVNKVLRLGNVPTDGTDGGASLFDVDPSALTEIQVTQGGINYVVPTKSAIAAGAVSTNVGIGQALSVNSAPGLTGLANDVSTHKIITITQANTDVTIGF